MTSSISFLHRHLPGLTFHCWRIAQSIPVSQLKSQDGGQQICIARSLQRGPQFADSLSLTSSLLLTPAASKVESLLAANPKLPSLRDLDDRLPIHWAVSYNHLPIVQILVQEKAFDADVADGSGWTPVCSPLQSKLPDNTRASMLNLHS